MRLVHGAYFDLRHLAAAVAAEMAMTPLPEVVPVCARVGERGRERGPGDADEERIDGPTRVKVVAMGEAGHSGANRRSPFLLESVFPGIRAGLYPFKGSPYCA